MTFSVSRVADRIEHLAKRWGLGVDVHFASTGSRYLTLTADDGTSVVVRISDHADAYGTSDFTIDPYESEIAAVRDWIRQHGARPRYWSRVMADAAERRLRAAGFRVARPTQTLVQVLDEQDCVLAMIDDRGLLFGPADCDEAALRAALERALAPADDGDCLSG